MKIFRIIAGILLAVFSCYILFLPVVISLKTPHSDSLIMVYFTYPLGLLLLASGLALLISSGSKKILKVITVLISVLVLLLFIKAFILFVANNPELLLSTCCILVAGLIGYLAYRFFYVRIAIAVMLVAFTSLVALLIGMNPFEGFLILLNGFAIFGAAVIFTIPKKKTKK